MAKHSYAYMYYSFICIHTMPSVGDVTEGAPQAAAETSEDDDPACESYNKDSDPNFAGFNTTRVREVCNDHSLGTDHTGNPEDMGQFMLKTRSWCVRMLRPRSELEG